MKNEEPAIRISLPQEIEDLTIGELLRHPETEINVANRTVTARRKGDKEVIFFQYSQVIGGRKNMESQVSSTNKKMEYLANIKEMKSEGIKQKDIAMKLGISQAYISELLKRSRMEKEELPNDNKENLETINNMYTYSKSYKVPEPELGRVRMEEDNKKVYVESYGEAKLSRSQMENEEGKDYFKERFQEK